MLVVFLQVLVAVMLLTASAQQELGGRPILLRQRRNTDVRTLDGTLNPLPAPTCNSNDFTCESENTYTPCGGQTQNCDPGYFCNPKCAIPCTANIPSC